MQSQQKITSLSAKDIENLKRKIPAWALEENRLERTFHFRDFRQAIDFVGKVADAAEKLDHHPDIHILYNKVILEASTHQIGGLSEKDFTLAEAVDSLG